MDSIWLCFSKENNIYANSIRRLTNSKINHVFFSFYSEEWNEWVSIEIDYRGTIIVPTKTIIKNMDKVRYFRCLDRDLREGLIKSKHLIGTKYGWIIVCGFLIKILYQRTFKKVIPNPFKSKDKIICTNFAITVLKNSGIAWAQDLDENSVSPGRLMKMILSDSEWEEKTSYERY